jgi:hypothetical protein
MTNLLNQVLINLIIKIMKLKDKVKKTEHSIIAIGFRSSPEQTTIIGNGFSVTHTPSFSKTFPNKHHHKIINSLIFTN